MDGFLLYILKSAGVSTLFLLCYRAFLKKETFFNPNRVFLLAGLVFSFIIPLISIKDVVWIDPTLLPSSNNIGLLDPGSNGTFEFNWISLLSVLYILGAALFFIRFLVNILSLKRVVAKGDIQKEGRINFVETKKNTPPFSFFNYLIYNPERLSKSDFPTIVAHERIHIYGLHSMDMLLIHAVILMQWFNPFIWFYKDSIEQNLEFIADQGALKSGRDRVGYQNLMLKATVGETHPYFSNSFYNSIIKKRIVMLNQNPSKKMGVFKTLLVIPLLGFFLLSFNVEKVYQYPISAEGQQNASDKSVELVIGKDTSNEELAKMKQNLAKDGIDFSYTAVRNDKMEIVDITVHISGKHSKGETFSSNYSSNSDSPIQPLIIFYDDEANVVSFGGAKHKRIQIHNSVDHTMHLNSLDEKEVVIKEENDTKKIFVDGKEVNEEDLDEMGFHIKTDDTDKHVSVHVLSDETSDEHIKIRKRAKSDKNTVVIKNSDDAEYIDVVSDVDIEVMGEAKDYLFIDTDGEAEPLYYIDGKKAKAKDFHKLSPSEIKSINVSKGEGAIKKYGKKAKNGVVEITTKNGN